MAEDRRNSAVLAHARWRTKARILLLQGTPRQHLVETAPLVVQQSAQALQGHALYDSYLSTCSVYNEDPLPRGINEGSPVVEADPSAGGTNYSADKRGAELAILESFGADANFTWIPPEFLLENDVQPWTEMPVWVSPELYGIFAINTSKAAQAELHCRPIVETVADTWAAMQTEKQPELNERMTAPGISAEKEASVLAAWTGRNHPERHCI